MPIVHTSALPNGAEFSVKQCSRCKLTKPLDDFYRAARLGSYRAACKKCTNEANSEYVNTKTGQANKLAASKRYRQANPGSRSLTDTQKLAKQCKEIERKYNITCAQRNALVDAQNGMCASCGKELINQVIDHDHVTGKVRGILCYSCNVSIGLLGDSSQGLEQALDYLRRANADY